MSRLRPAHGRLRSFIRLAVVTGCMAVLVCLLFWGWVQWHYGKLIWSDARSVPGQPVAIVFGAGIRADGGLSPMLRDRVDAAIQLQRSGVVSKLLFSGDNRFVDYDEPGRMYDYALAQGVSPDAIVLDYAGRRTYDTCYRAVSVFGVSSAVLVTQRFHLPRALFTCANLGLESIGFSADLRTYRSTRYYVLRDGLALLLSWWDLWIAHPEPVLGPRIDIGLAG